MKSPDIRRPETASIDPGTIGTSFAPRRSPSVATVELEGDFVLLDEGNGRLYRLNATAALPWSCFDGTATLDEIVTDLSDVFSSPRAQVLEDVLSVAWELGRSGLLAGVRSHEDCSALSAWEHEAEWDDPHFLVEPPSS